MRGITAGLAQASLRGPRGRRHTVRLLSRTSARRTGATAAQVSTFAPVEPNPRAGGHAASGGPSGPPLSNELSPPNQGPTSSRGNNAGEGGGGGGGDTPPSSDHDGGHDATSDLGTASRLPSIHEEGSDMALPRPSPSILPKFDGEDWEIWSFRFKTWSGGQGLWQYFAKDAPPPTAPPADASHEETYYYKRDL